MGPKKKNKGHNDFYYFMQDMSKTIEREQGRRITDLQQLGQLCTPKWLELSDEEKKKYKDMAKANKKRTQEDLNQRSTCDGKSLAVAHREQVEQENRFSRMIKDIREIVKNSHDMMQLNDMSFFFIHLESLVEISEGRHLPCEVAAVEYSLSSGVFKTFHSFVRPPSIPLGQGYNIRMAVENRHRLDPDDEPLANDATASDHVRLLDRLEDFLNPVGQTPRPPVYTLEETANQVEQMLETIYQWAGHGGPPADMKIYHLDELLASVGSYASPQTSNGFFPAMEFGAGSHLDRRGAGIAAYKLAGQQHQLAYGMCCAYHDYYERSHSCSLTKVKSWSYIMSELCCGPQEIEMLEGHHKPLQRSNSHVETVFEVELSSWERPPVDRIAEVRIEKESKTRSAPAGIISESGSISGLPEMPVWKMTNGLPGPGLNTAATASSGEPSWPGGSWAQPSQSRPANNFWTGKPDFFKEETSGAENVNTMDDGDFPALGAGPNKKQGWPALRK